VHFVHFRREDPEGPGHKASGRDEGVTPGADRRASNPPGPQGAGGVRSFRVAVTRPRRAGEGPQRLDALLAEAGFQAGAYPLTRIDGPSDPRPLERAARDLLAGVYDVLLLTSARGAAALALALDRASGPDHARGTGTRSIPGRGPTGLEVWVVGEATGRAAAEAGFPPDRIPDRYVAEGLLEAAEKWGPLEGRRILFPRAAEGRDLLPERLVAGGARVTVVEAYRAVEVPDEARRLVRDAREGRVDGVALTAGSQARVLGREAEGHWPLAVPLVAIGPATAVAARAAGLPDPRIAEPHTFDGVLAALKEVRSIRSTPDAVGRDFPPPS
jgi:uroporphyrinogen III methyltransferase / synthase